MLHGAAEGHQVGGTDDQQDQDAHVDVTFDAANQCTSHDAIGLGIEGDDLWQAAGAGDQHDRNGEQDAPGQRGQQVLSTQCQYQHQCKGRQHDQARWIGGLLHRLNRRGVGDAALLAAAEDHEQRQRRQGCRNRVLEAAFHHAGDIRALGRGGDDGGVRHRGQVIAEDGTGQNCGKQQGGVTAHRDAGRIHQRAEGDRGAVTSTDSGREHGCEQEGEPDEPAAGHVRDAAQPDKPFDQSPDLQNLSEHPGIEPGDDGDHPDGLRQPIEQAVGIVLPATGAEEQTEGQPEQCPHD